MNCQEYQELVSAAVDLQLTDPEQEAFEDHGSHCDPCRREFEAEAATKHFITARVRRVAAPPEVAKTVSKLLKAQPAGASGSWVTALLRKPYVKPAIGFALAFAAVLLLVKSPSDEKPPQGLSLQGHELSGASDVILQSLRNHSALLDGQIKPQLVSGGPGELQSIFSGITDYSVHLPKMKDCQLVGGVQDEFAGTKIAHVVYQRDTEIVYILQACWATVKKGEKLSLPEKAKAELEQTGWYSCSEPDGRSVVLWVKGRTLCAAVSRMSKDDLISCLTSDEPGAPGW